MLARRTRVVPGELAHRMSKKPTPSTSPIYIHRMADGLRHTKLPLVPHQRHGPCGEAMPTRGCRSPAKSCGGILAGYRCNIDGIAVCLVDNCRMLTRVLCVLFHFCCRRERSAKKVIVPWALGRLTAPHAHRTARPTHMASIDSLRMTAVEHRAHTRRRRRSSSSSSTRRQSVVCYFSQAHISHRSRLFARILQIPKILFPLQNQKLWFGFSHAVSNPILF